MNIIAAVDNNWAIGFKGKLLVRIPQDQKFFQEITTGNVIVMGRKTLSEFPNGLPLVNRTNIILSKNKDFKAKGAIIVHSKEELLEELRKFKSENIFIIGGGSVYEMMLPYCSTAHITKIDYEYNGDTFFPDLSKKKEWILVGESEEQTYFDLEYEFLKFENKNPLML